MKKTVFALFAVILVLSLATCDLLDSPVAKSVAPEGMATLTINVKDGGTGRALTTTNAPLAADYYEVIFLTGGKYYQMAWDKTTYPTASPSITIPTANYNGSGGNDAVLFAGTQTDKILLGVGVLSTTNIPAGTTSVTFTVGALKSVVDNTINSAFKITSPTNDGAGHSYATSTGITYSATGGVPIFPIPGTGYDPTSGTAEDVIATWTVAVPNSSYVKYGTTAWSVVPTTITWPGTETAYGGTLTYDPRAKTAGAELESSTVFTIDITVPNTGTPAGVCGFYINVPVRAFGNGLTFEANTPGGTPVSSATTTPTAWVIRGGTSITAADAGSGVGAVVILGVGVHASWEATFTIPNPGTYNEP